MTPALDIFRRTFAETESVAAAIEAVYAAGRNVATKRRDPEQLEFIFLAACAATGADPTLIRSEQRRRCVHRARVEVWRWMAARHCSPGAIGIATNRHRTAVIQGLRVYGRESETNGKAKKMLGVSE